MTVCIPTALTHCGIEISNPARTNAYQLAGLLPSSIEWAGNVPPNAYLVANNAFATYTSPAADPAPWYDAAYPESANYYGFITDTVTGYGSPATRTGDARGGYIQGKSFNSEDLGSRVHEWKGVLLAGDAQALEYGKRWLANQLGASCSTCGTCETATKHYAPANAADWEDGRYVQYEVVTASGPDFVDIADTVATATFTLEAGNPGLYKNPVNYLSGVPLVQPSAGGVGCMPFDEWLCGVLPENNICLTIDPPPFGEIAPIIYFDARNGAASGIQVNMYEDCPGGEPGVNPRGITVPRLDLGWQLTIDSAKGIINAITPDGVLVNGSSLVRALDHADPFIRIRDCDQTGCVCVGVEHPCNGGLDTLVTFDAQLRFR